MKPEVKIITLATLFIFMCITVQMAAQSSNGKDCGETLQRYMKTYPASDLCDVYKFCFQDVFGPAHLSLDTVKNIKNINEEIARFKTLNGPDYEYTGCEGNYVRVNLSLVKRGVLEAHSLADCLSRSSEPPNLMTIEEWKYRWGQLEKTLLHTTPQPGHFALDSESIEALLDRGGYAVHHSYSYNSTYNFHYRIIRRDIFEKEILPLISTVKKKH